MKQSIMISCKMMKWKTLSLVWCRFLHEDNGKWVVLNIYPHMKLKGDDKYSQYGPN